MKKMFVDPKSFLIGVLFASLMFLSLGAVNQQFNSREMSRLKNLAAIVDDNGNLNLGKRKIIMQGSSIYDDGSQGGGLTIKGGANRVHMHGSQIMYQSPVFKRGVLDLNADLNMGKKKIIMQGSSIYDDGSQGGGLSIKGGAGRIHLFGKTVPH